MRQGNSLALRFSETAEGETGNHPSASTYIVTTRRSFVHAKLAVVGFYRLRDHQSAGLSIYGGRHGKCNRGDNNGSVRRGGMAAQQLEPGLRVVSPPLCRRHTALRQRRKSRWRDSLAMLAPLAERARTPDNSMMPGQNSRGIQVTYIGIITIISTAPMRTQPWRARDGSMRGESCKSQKQKRVELCEVQEEQCFNAGNAGGRGAG